LSRIDSEPIIKSESEEVKKKKEALFILADKFREAAKEKRKHLREEGFKVVVTGKGGAGKTTISALLARILARRGYRVLAVDEDPQVNLPNALGLPKEVADKIAPLSRNVDYIEEKTGAQPGEEWGVFLIVNVV
jgi:CO dehydrogenase maturation factor